MDETVQLQPQRGIMYQRRATPWKTGNTLSRINKNKISPNGAKCTNEGQRLGLEIAGNIRSPNGTK